MFYLTCIKFLYLVDLSIDHIHQLTIRCCVSETIDAAKIWSANLTLGSRSSTIFYWIDSFVVWRWRIWSFYTSYFPCWFFCFPISLSAFFRHQSTTITTFIHILLNRFFWGVLYSFYTLLINWGSFIRWRLIRYWFCVQNFFFYKNIKKIIYKILLSIMPGFDELSTCRLVLAKFTCRLVNRRAPYSLAHATLTTFRTNQLVYTL